jgi:hypothetical protein
MVRCVLRGGLELGAELGITIVCHNVARKDIAAILPESIRSAVTLKEFRDGLPSPAGPRTFALARSRATYVSLLDSDDSLDDGALRDWLTRAEAGRLDAVIPPERHADGGDIRTPVVRRFHSGVLDPLKDRISYRTAPLGLIRREALVANDVRYASDVRNGSDQIFALKLWFGPTRIVYARGGPAYVVGADAVTRVSFQLQALSADLKATTLLMTDPWFTGLALPARRAIATKSVRVHLFGALDRRIENSDLTAETLADARAFLSVADSAAPGYSRSLSVADLRLIRAIEAEDFRPAEISRLAAARRRFGRPATLLTRDPRALLLPDAPLRFMVASLLH